MRRRNVNPRVTQKVHFKMFKSKHGWLVAGLTMLSFASVSLIGMNDVHADTATENNRTATVTPSSNASVASTSSASSQTASTTSATSLNSAASISVQSNNSQVSSSAAESTSSASKQSETSQTAKSVATSDASAASATSVASATSTSNTSITSNTTSVQSVATAVSSQSAQKATNLELLAGADSTAASQASTASDQTSTDVTVTFENLDGTITHSTVTKGGTVSKTNRTDLTMAVPADGRGGTERFDGWFYKTSDGVSGTEFDFDQPVLTSSTIVPKFTRLFNVKFSYPRNNGTGTDATEVTTSVEENSTVAVADKVPVADNGQRFVYWYDTSTAANIAHIAAKEAPDAYVFGVDKVTHDFELDGYFADVHTVTFHTDGAPVDPQLVPTGSTATYEKPTRAGYTFVGWTTESNGKDNGNGTDVTKATFAQNEFKFTTAINTDTNLYGVWDPQQVSYNIVSYD